MARILLLLFLASVGTCDDRYWGSYSAVYPAGGGGNSGALALDLAARQEGWTLASRAPTSRALESRPQESRAQEPRAQEKSSPAQAGVEAGQYVHNPEWDLTPFQLWKRKQAAKAGTHKARLNSLPEPARKVVTVRKQKPRQQQQRQQQQEQRQQQQQRQQLPEQSRFANFHPVAAVEPAAQPARQQPRRQQAYYQPAPRQPVQKVQPVFRQPVYQASQPAAQPSYQPTQLAYQPAQPIHAVQTTYQQTGLMAYPRAQHQTYTPEYIYEANNNAQRIYSYKAEKYQAKASGESYSYQALY